MHVFLGFTFWKSSTALLPWCKQQQYIFKATRQFQKNDSSSWAEWHAFHPSTQEAEAGTAWFYIDSSRIAGLQREREILGLGTGLGQRLLFPRSKENNFNQLQSETVWWLCSTRQRTDFRNHSVNRILIAPTIHTRRWSRQQYNTKQTKPTSRSLWRNQV